MKILNMSLLLSFFGIVFISSLSAEKLCIADKSIEYQKNRYVSQGLLVSFMKEKMILSWPVQVCQCWISSLYGKRGAGFHHGVDLAATKGTHVFAVADGYVEKIEKSNEAYGYGNMILVNHPDLGCKTRYAHLHSVHTSIGHKVKRGQKIGTVGATGNVISKNRKSDPSHLHFEIYKDGNRVDPLKYLFASDVMLLKNKNMRV